MFIECVCDVLSERLFVYVFKYENMWNGMFKEMWVVMEVMMMFFVGLNKVLRVALGRDAESEASEGAVMFGVCVKGDCGVMFINLFWEDVESVFERFVVKDYVRIGVLVRETVTVEAGSVYGSSGAFMEYIFELMLCKNGMLMKLNCGVIELEVNYMFCKEG